MSTMLTPWAGVATPDLTAGTTTFLTALQIPVILSDTPTVPTVVSLSGLTRVILLWTPDTAVRYAVDATPAALTPSTALQVDFGQFQLGGTAIPGFVQPVALPDDDSPHTLGLVSEQPNVYVLIQVFVEQE